MSREILEWLAGLQLAGHEKPKKPPCGKWETCTPRHAQLTPIGFLGSKLTLISISVYIYM